MALRKAKLKQIRPPHMSLEQLRALLERRILGIQYIRFLISLKEANQ